MVRRLAQLALVQVLVQVLVRALVLVQVRALALVQVRALVQALAQLPRRVLLRQVLFHCLHRKQC